MTISLLPTSAPPQKEVILRTGPPTREELRVFYPAKFTWAQLKTFVNAGDLGLLKRDNVLQVRYLKWVEGINAEYGSMVDYLLNYRLQWGKRDTLSLLTSALDANEPQSDKPATPQHSALNKIKKELPPLPSNAPKYFTRDAPSEYLSIIQNDWPYSVPTEIEHTLIWTRLPIYHEDLVAQSIAARVKQDGLWGFTGSTSPPPSPSTLPSALPALAEWGVTMDKLTRSAPPNEEEAVLIRRAGEEVYEFIKRRWNESEWETAWFINPSRIQSVPGLAHIHVFARQKL